MKNWTPCRTAVSVALIFAIAGCAQQRVKKSAELADASNGDATNETSADAGMTSTRPTDAGGPTPEPSVRKDVLRSLPELQTIHFDYDSVFINPGVRTTLVDNARWLKDHPKTRVQVTGSCDQRGTVEYNLALGQRRAAAVREYYMHLGIAGDRIATISYGKERLLCQAPDEACWQSNRRSETLEAVSSDAMAASIP